MEFGGVGGGGGGGRDGWMVTDPKLSSGTSSQNQEMGI